MSDQIKLDDCPDILKAAVKDELTRVSKYDPRDKIISCTAHKSLNEADTTYTVYILNANTFVILTYIETPPDRYQYRVMRDMVTIGDIKEIIRAAPEYFKY